MAKSDMKGSPKPQGNNSMVIDVESLLVPFSILIAGLMISLSIVFTLKGSTLSGDNKNKDTNTNQDTNGDTAGSDDGTATVNIDDDPYLGDKEKATVAIVEFSDYECPFCQRHFTDTYPDIVKNYVDSGKAILVFRDFPLSFHDPVATNAALAAQCVFDQKGNEAYFKFHDLYFANTKTNGEGLTGGESKMQEYAKQAGADVNKFKSCYSSKKFAEEIQKDMSDGSAAGITGTPGFIIGKFDKDGNVKDGVVLAGAYPYDDFASVIDRALGQ